MTDREKVIKGLEVCSSIAEGESCQKDCPYYQDACYGYDQLMRDALAMLKEQEPLKPKKVRGYNPPMYTIYEYECEKCQSPIMNKQPFCMGCGRRVIWNA